ncbi:hypothetical protein NC652_037922 [Populus alba x Populus x berolinensis]|nr:hypothetical protein NC652_037922 [Populus alba x Populus x berolinensis]
MEIWKWVFIGVIWYASLVLSIGAMELGRSQHTKRISGWAYFELHLDDHIWLRWTKLVLQSIAMQYAGSAGDVLEDDPVRRLKVFVYELPSKYNKKILQKDTICLTHMLAAKIFMHRFLLSSSLRMLNPKEAEWFNTLVLTTFLLCLTTLVPASTLKKRRLSKEEFFPSSNEMTQKVVTTPGDDIVLPFADAIPWEEIGVFVDEKDVPNLDTILTSIPPKAMPFPQPAQARDAFHQVLNGLAQKLSYDTSVYLESGENILNWTAGLVGDLKPC